MLTIKPKIGLIIGKTNDPTYSFTTTRVDAHEKRFFGEVKIGDCAYRDSYFDQMKSDGTYEIPEPFILLADPESTQDKPMTQPIAMPAPTQWTCYNCGKICFDKAGRPCDATLAAWCENCANGCAKASSILNPEDIAVLIKNNGMLRVGIHDAERASPTLKNNPKIKVEKGQVWRAGADTTTTTITDVKDGFAFIGESTKWGKLTAEGYPDSWHPSWRLIQPAPQAQPQSNTLAVAGQTYRRDDGWTIKIVKTSNGRVEATQIGEYSGWKDGHHHYNLTSLETGKMSPRWKLVEEKPAPVKMKVGQVWTCGGTTCRIIQIRKDNSVDVIRTWNGKDDVVNRYGSVLTDGTSGFGSSWSLAQDIDYAKTKVEAGQTWEHSSGATAEISGVNGGHAVNRGLDYWGKLTSEGYPDGWAEPPNGWYLTKIEATPTTLKMKIGQVWACGKLGQDHKIVGIKNGKISVLIGNSPKVHEGFGRIKADGSPDSEWGNFHEDAWHMVREEPLKVKIGQKWRWIGSSHSALVGQVFTVEEFKVSGECKMSNPLVAIYRDSVNDSVHPEAFQKWELVEDAISPTIATNTEPVIGSIWIDRRGVAFKIIEFRETSKGCYSVDLHKRQSSGSWSSGFSWDWSRGKLNKDDGKEWTLEETKPTESSEQPPIGSIWKVGEVKFRVVRFLGGGGRNVALESYTGGQWISGSSWSWVNGKFEPLYGKEWTLEEPKKAYPEPKVGQVWTANGQRFTVKEIRKAAHSAWDKEIVFNASHQGTIQWDWKDGKFNSGYTWELLTDVSAIAPDVALDVKVGQIWDSGDGNKFRIRKTEPTLAWLEIKNDEGHWVSGGAWYLKDGKWREPLVPGKFWTLMPEKEISAPPPAIGSIWSVGGTKKYRVAAILDPRSKDEEARVVMDLKDSDGIWKPKHREWSWKDGKFLSSYDWKQVIEEGNKTVEKQTLKIGQIWGMSGTRYRVRNFDGSPGTVRLDRWDHYKSEWVLGSDFDYVKDGKFKGDNWVLEQDVKQVELKVGQVWTVSNDKYRIHSFEGSPPNRARLDWWDPYTNTYRINSSYHTVKDGILVEIAATKWVLREDVAPEKAVSEKPTFRQMMGADMVNATYRVAAHQLTKASKQALLSLMEKQGHNSQSIKALSELLDTEFGSALVGMTLGMGLTYIPQVSSSGRAQRLATEFRTGSMTTAGNVVADAMTQHFIPAITNALSGIPKEQIRVSTSLPAPEEQPELHEESGKEARA